MERVIFAFTSGDSRGSITSERRLGSSKIDTHRGRQEGSVHVRHSTDFDILSYDFLSGPSFCLFGLTVPCKSLTLSTKSKLFTFRNR